MDRILLACTGAALWALAGCASPSSVTTTSGTGGATGSGGSAGTGGTAKDAGGSGGAEAGASNDAGPPLVTLGTPITAPDGTWTTVPFPENTCRDGTSPHLEVHLNSASKKFAIYLEGGGACFNDASCTLLNVDLPSYVLGQGIFNFNRSDNPIRDWNIFYVPYCTGDVHAGSNPAGYPGPVTGPQSYTGYTNLEHYLSRILATVPGATDELLVGSSAGGFGAGLNADLVAANMPASVQRFTMLDDSGPPMSSQIIQPCLQDQLRKVWGLDSTFLATCGAGCPTPNDYVYDWMTYLMNKYGRGPLSAKFMGGLVSWTGDAIISTFYGFGAQNCMSSVPIAISGPVFEAGLLDFRSKIQAQTNLFGTYYAGGTDHTFLIQDMGGLVQGTGLLGGLYDTQVNGVRLVDWMSDLLAHKQATHVGP
jgi:hypothetical protein